MEEATKSAAGEHRKGNAPQPIAIGAMTTLSNPNRYAGADVICFELELPDDDVPDALLAALAELTGLHGLDVCEHESLDDFAHVFEHVCVGLQNAAGLQLRCLRSERAWPSRRRAIVPFEDAEVCARSAELACELIARAMRSAAEDASKDLSNDGAERLREFVGFAVRTMLPVQDRAVVAAAKARNIPTRRLVGRTIVLGQGVHQQRLSGTKTSLTNVVSNDLAANKDYSRRLLETVGLPVPRYARVYRARDAVAAAKRIGFPVVVKPNNGGMGRGVAVGLRRSRDVRAAYRAAREVGRSVLVEELIEGDDYRFLIVGGKFVAAAKRVPGHVTGDGILTVNQLVERVNRDPRRGSGPTFAWTILRLDERAERVLKEAGYAANSIPEEGKLVYLRRNANTSDGGTAVDVTDIVHPANIVIAERAAQVIGLDIAGVDFLTRDITTPLQANGGRICEINSRPGVRKHMWPAEGGARDVAGPILDMLFPDSHTGRVPLIGLVGEGDLVGAATTLASVLGRLGYRVGCSTSRGLSVQGIDEPPPANLIAAMDRLTLDPSVDVIVLAMPSDEVAARGLPCDLLDVTAIVGAAESPKGLWSQDMTVAVRLAAGVTSRAVLIQQSDHWLRDDIESKEGKMFLKIDLPISCMQGADDLRQQIIFAEQVANILGHDEQAVCNALEGHLCAIG